VHAALGRAAGAGGQTSGLTPIGFLPHPAYFFFSLPISLTALPSLSFPLQGRGRSTFFFYPAVKVGAGPASPVFAIPLILSLEKFNS